MSVHHLQPSSRELDTWIAGIARGDMAAMEQLYHGISASVYAFALSILKNSHDAEDVLHDCFVNLYGAAGEYRSEGKPMAWILTVARNLCLRRLRQQQKTTALSQEDWHACLTAQTRMTAEEKVVLEQCMEKLSDQERQIVVLHAVAGFKHRQIAELMDMALPTVLSKYHRAIKKLRQYL